MNIKQQYIVLYAQDGKTTLGFVKLTFHGEEALVQAQATIRSDGTAELCLDSGTAMVRLPMQAKRWEYTASGSVTIGNGRIVAAVCGTKGLLAMGQSMMPKAYWHACESMFKANKKKPAADDEAIPVIKTGAIPGKQEQTADRTPTPVPNQKEIESPKMATPTMRDEAIPMQQAEFEPPNCPLPDGAQQPFMEPIPVYEHKTPMEQQSISTEETERMPRRVPMLSARSRIRTFSESSAGSNEELSQELNNCADDVTQRQNADQTIEVDAYDNQNGPSIYGGVRGIKTGDGRQHGVEAVALSVMGPYADQWCWRRVVSREADYSYLMGEVVQDGKVVAVAVAVPGNYAPSPPANLQGFHAYRDGHWILAQDAQTGEVLDI